MDPEIFEKDSFKVIAVIKEYLDGIGQNKFPVLPDFTTIAPGYLQRLLPSTAPEEGEDIALILEDFKKLILPGVVHRNHPDFHAYYPATCSTPSMLGDLLAASVGAHNFTWLSSPSLTELEVIVLNWLARALQLPSKFIYAADQDGNNHCGGGMSEVNASVVRAAKLSLLQCRVIKSTRVDRNLIMSAKDVQEAIEVDRKKGFLPLMCIANLGTTDTCDFDALDEIGPICRKENVWLHVDAAYAGCALLCPEFRHLFSGLEFADSLCFNPYKMLLMNFDCSVLWISNYKILTEALAITPAYLRHSTSGMPDFKDWSINLGRRNRALKIWLVLRNFGLAKLRSLIRKHHELAKGFASLIENDGRFEIVNNVRFGLVCFKLKAGNKANEELLKILTEERQLFLTAGELPSHLNKNESDMFLRFVSNHQVNQEDMERAAATITEAATRVLLQNVTHGVKDGATI